MNNSQLFIVTGPESSGKTTLATQLCDSLQAPLVPELSREYLTGKFAKNNAFSYRQEDLLNIAKLQHKQEQKLLEFQAEKIVCDTDLLVLMIWSEVKYANCDTWITNTFEQVINNRNHRHYLLCHPEVPWQEDPLRENPDDREQLFLLYLNKLQAYQLKYTVVTGNQQQRLQLALKQLQAHQHP